MRRTASRLPLASLFLIGLAGSSCAKTQTPGDPTSPGSDTQAAAPVKTRWLDFDVSKFASCGLDEHGQVWCVPNAFSALAGDYPDGTVLLRAEVPPVRSLSVGNQGTVCGALATSGVLCWSSGATPESTPVAGIEQVEFVELVAGTLGDFCGLSTTGEAWCWNEMADEPAERVGTDYRSLVTDGAAVCGLKVDSGELECSVSRMYRQFMGGAMATLPWTAATRVLSVSTTSSSQLDGLAAVLEDGTIQPIDTQPPSARSPEPTPDANRKVALPGKAQSVYFGEHSCAVVANDPDGTKGSVYCWGRNESGEAGAAPSPEIRPNEPQRVEGLSGVEKIVGEAGRSCALLETGEVRCWGNVAEFIPPKAQIARVASNVEGTLVLAGTTCHWGADAKRMCTGRLGFADDGSSGEIPLPTGGTTVGTVGVSCTLVGRTLDCGSVTVLDKANYETLGTYRDILAVDAGPRLGTIPTLAALGDSGGSTTVYLIDGAGGREPWMSHPGIVDFAAGFGHTCGIDRAGAVVCQTRYTGMFELPPWITGIETDPGSAVEVPDLRPATDVAATVGGSCVLHEDGGVTCWGNFDAGAPHGPKDMGLTDIVVLRGGRQHFCALDAAGAVACWGTNSSGELGLQDRAPKGLPARVEGLPPLVTLEGSDEHMCGLTKDKELWCWGADDARQLGGGTQQSFVPLAVVAPD